MRSILASALLSAALAAQVPLPPHASVYNGYSRGFNFTSSTNFVIVQLALPLDAFQPGDTASYLVRVNGVTALHSIGNAGPLATAIVVTSGDVVDVIGNWSPPAAASFTAHNSYGNSAPYPSVIEGVPHTLNRCGWQWDIGDTTWSTSGTTGTFLAPTTGSIGRVLMYTAGSGGTAAINAVVGLGCGTPALSLTPVTRPIIGTSWDLAVGNVPASAVLGLDVYGLTDPGLNDLGFLGMPGCGLRAALDFTTTWLPSGATHARSLLLPNDPSLVNIHVFTTSAVFTAPPVNAFGALTANAIDGRIGDV
jgi:hypothetical protein